MSKSPIVTGLSELDLVPTTLLSQRQRVDMSTTVPVSLISLSDTADRRTLLLERGIPKIWVANYWPAIDLRTGTAEAVEKVADQAAALIHLGRRLTPAEVGCALSHQRAGAWLAGSGYDLMLVLEDDVIPTSPSFSEAVSDVCRLLLNHARQGRSFICHLGARQEQVTKAIRRTVHSRSFDRSRKSTNIYLYADPIRTLWRAHAYLISKQAAMNAVDRGPIFTVADDWCGMRRAGLIDQIFFSEDAVFEQDETIASTVDKPQSLPHALSKPNYARSFLKQYYGHIWLRVMLFSSQLLARLPVTVS